MDTKHRVKSLKKGNDMALTFGNWVALFIIFVFCAGGAICIAISNYDVTPKNILLCLLIPFAICVVIALVLNWYHLNMASGIRAYKDYQSEIENGIDREITITAEDGREIFYYEGKVDVESNHEDNYIKFEGEDGRRFIIYYGIQDTIKIIEKVEE